MVSSDLGSDTEALELETAQHNEHFPPSGTSNIEEDHHTTSEVSKYTARLRGLADHVQDAGMPFLSFLRFHVMQILHLQNEIIKIHRVSSAGDEEEEEVAPLDMPQLGEMIELYSEATILPPRTTHPTKITRPNLTKRIHISTPALRNNPFIRQLSSKSDNGKMKKFKTALSSYSPPRNHQTNIRADTHQISSEILIVGG